MPLVKPAIVPPQNAEQIVGAYFLFLQSIAQWSEMLATKSNAIAFCSKLLIPAWERGEPILLATLDGTIIGATFTTFPDPTIEYRVKFASGHGTWVSPQWRNCGVAKALLNRVRQVCREAGIKRQVGLIHDGNEASRCTFIKLGFVPSGSVLTYDIP